MNRRLSVYPIVAAAAVFAAVGGRLADFDTPERYGLDAAVVSVTIALALAWSEPRLGFIHEARAERDSQTIPRFKHQLVDLLFLALARVVTMVVVVATGIGLLTAGVLHVFGHDVPLLVRGVTGISGALLVPAVVLVVTLTWNLGHFWWSLDGLLRGIFSALKGEAPHESEY